MLAALDTHHPWYVVQCKPRQEHFAARMLETLPGISVFLPEYKVSQRTKECKVVPLFPGYFFVQVDSHRTPLSRINASPGVIRLVSFCGEPEPVASSIIDLIYERVTLLCTRNSKSQQFRSGDKVRFKSEPLRMLEAIFLESLSSRQRVRVLLNMLGRQHIVQTQIDKLEKVDISLT